MAAKSAPKVAIDDLVETPAAGLLMAEVPKSEFHVDVRIDVGGVFGIGGKAPPKLINQEKGTKKCY
jgi:hypothetical protein